MSQHYHFIGIGGIGMSGIARLFLHQGFTVSGSDLKTSRITDELRGMGAQIYIGHASVNINNADVVVYSSAIQGDNPEMKEAVKRGVTLVRRAQALAFLMQDKTVITVTGSHGKTTTTSLISYLLLEAGFCPTVAIGGVLKNIESNACHGDGNFFVAEADESDGSFLYYQPTYSIITNIDYEHMDYYKDFKNVLVAYREFSRKTSPQGCLFCCADDPYIRDAVKEYDKKLVLFGLSGTPDITARNIIIDGLSSQFECWYKGAQIEKFTLALGGMHNISNALAVIALGLELHIDMQYIKKALSGYKGARRRLEIKLKDRWTIIDDYAHHPTEIEATLSAVRHVKAGRVIAVFQPHRYSRTQLLLDKFARCFALADEVIITDIYAASELPIEGVTARSLYDKIKEYFPQKHVELVSKEDIVRRVSAMMKPDDIVITLGAGDIAKVCDDLVAAVQN